MSTEPGDELLPEGVPPFDDPAHDDIRGLLADARATDPVPGEVVARLDAVLADLRAAGTSELPESEKPETLVALASRRRPRARLLLTAAAAVVVVGAGGVGLGNVLSQTGTSDSADKAASAPEVASADSGGSATFDSDGRRQAAVPRLTRTAFAADAARVLAQPPQTLSDLKLRDGTERSSTGATTVPQAPTSSPSESAGPASGDDSPTPLSGYAAGQRPCITPPRVAGATAYPILLDGIPATLVVRQAAAGRRVVQAWSCEGTTVLATATLPG